MMKRIKQFSRALVAKGPSEDENKILKKYLTLEAEKYFRSMTIPDQRHVLNVFYTANELQKNKKLPVDNFLLNRCCLLHDIGRGRKMTTFCKTFSVILDKLCHRWAVRRGDSKEKFLGDMFYHYYHHAELSATILRNIGMKEEASIVELHHHDEEKLKEMYQQGNKIAGSNELKILKEADDLN